MPITRTPIQDDDGSGTTGTILNNAWKQELYGQIDAADAAGQLYTGNGSNTGTGIVTLVSVPMPAFAPNDHFTIIVGLYQYAQVMTGGLYLVVGGTAIRLDDVGGAAPLPANTGALWTGTFRANQLSNALVFGMVTGGSGTTAANVGATRMATSTIPASWSWSAGGWFLGLQSNGQASGGTQFWNLKVGRG